MNTQEEIQAAKEYGDKKSIDWLEWEIMKNSFLAGINYQKSLISNKAFINLFIDKEPKEVISQALSQEEINELNQNEFERL